jgi:hypothetical protein
MARGERKVDGSPKDQGITEEPTYEFDFSELGTPSDPSVVLYDMISYADVSANHLSGSPSIDGNIVTTPAVKDLVAGGIYRLVCTATIGGEPLSVYLELYGEV